MQDHTYGDILQRAVYNDDDLTDGRKKVKIEASIDWRLKIEQFQIRSEKRADIYLLIFFSMIRFRFSDKINYVYFFHVISIKIMRSDSCFCLYCPRDRSTPAVVHARWTKKCVFQIEWIRPIMSLLLFDAIFKHMHKQKNKLIKKYGESKSPHCCWNFIHKTAVWCSACLNYA